MYKKQDNAGEFQDLIKSKVSAKGSNDNSLEKSG